MTTQPTEKLLQVWPTENGFKWGQIEVRRFGQDFVKVGEVQCLDVLLPKGNVEIWLGSRGGVHVYYKGRKLK